MTLKRSALLLTILLSVGAVAFAADQVRTANGVVEGRGTQRSGVRIFRGIPFAQPPTGELRWRESQPVMRDRCPPADVPVKTNFELSSEYSRAR